MFLLFAQNLRYDESNQSHHVQEELADNIQDEVSGPDFGQSPRLYHSVYSVGQET